MSAKDVLRSTEKSALENNQIVSLVVGKTARSKTNHKKSFSAAIFVTAMIAIFALFFSFGNLIPSAISERLIEETDVQYADAVESKILVFKQALISGDVPNNTAMRLKENGVLVGVLENDNFTETNTASSSLVLKINDKIVTAGDFQNEINNNAALYNAFNKATYSRAAYYYDDSAKAVFRRLGTSRNNFLNDESFNETMAKIIGQGSDIEVNSVGLYEKDNPETEEKYYEYGVTGGNVDSDNSAETFVSEISAKSLAADSKKATLAAASSINVADTISKEQKSSLLFLAFMENISKMKAGFGDDSNINEAMNYLYEVSDNEVVDVKTGEVITVSGSMLESYSLSAILSGEKIDPEKVENYSSDRVIKTIENQLQITSSGSIISDTVASSSRGIRGTIGRFIEWGESATESIVSKVTPTVKNSLTNNSFEDIKGIRGGELLVEGAVNVGKELAKASGATAGDATAVKMYAKLNSEILALDAKADRLNRSPFDITSKNTFLGSILYNLAVSVVKTPTITSGFRTFSNLVGKSVANLLPTTFADDETNGFLTNFGDCETLNKVGAVGSASCAMVATFDTSTLNDIYTDMDFINFVKKNTVLENGTRVIKNGSDLANFIIYNNERMTPVGVLDGGILASLDSGFSNILFVSNILDMVKKSLGATEKQKEIASGQAFINSNSNENWKTYKYAQRYVSLARAQEALRQYDGDETAYSNILFFEGMENPVLAFTRDYYNIANK